MPALTESDAQARAALLAIDSYDVSIDLTSAPVRSRTVIRFRCARPGAASFADLTARVGGAAAVLMTDRLRTILRTQEAELRTAAELKRRS